MASRYQEQIEEALRAAGFTEWAHVPADDPQVDPEYHLSGALSIQYNARRRYAILHTADRSPLQALSQVELGMTEGDPSDLVPVLKDVLAHPPLGVLRNVSTRVDASEVVLESLARKGDAKLLSLSGAFTAETRASLSLVGGQYRLDFVYAGLLFEGILRDSAGAEIARYRDAPEVAHDLDLLRRGMQINRVEAESMYGVLSARIDGLHTAYLTGTLLIDGCPYPVALRGQRADGEWSLMGERGPGAWYELTGVPAISDDHAEAVTVAALQPLLERERDWRDLYCRAEADRCSAALLNVVGLQGRFPDQEGRSFYKAREVALESEIAYVRWLAARPEVPLIGRKHDEERGMPTFERERTDRREEDRGMDPC